MDTRAVEVMLFLFSLYAAWMLTDGLRDLVAWITSK